MSEFSDLVEKGKIYWTSCSMAKQIFLIGIKF